MNPIGAEIRRLREAMGLTLMEFGAHVGMPWQTVAAYERGAVVPPSDRLLVIAHKTRRVSPPFRLEHVARAVALAPAAPVAQAA